MGYTRGPGCRHEKGREAFQQTIENTSFTTKPCALNQRASLTTLPSRRQEAPASRLNEAGHSPDRPLSPIRAESAGCSGRLTAPASFTISPSRTPNRARIRYPRGRLVLACSLDNVLSINGLVQQSAPTPISSSTAPRERPWLGEGPTSVAAPASIFQVRPAPKVEGDVSAGGVSEATLKGRLQTHPLGGAEWTKGVFLAREGGASGLKISSAVLCSSFARSPGSAGWLSQELSANRKTFGVLGRVLHPRQAPLGPGFLSDFPLAEARG